MADLTGTQRAVLRELCNTFVPAISVRHDPTGFWGRTASDLGVDDIIGNAVLGNLPPGLRQPLVDLLDFLAAQNFIGSSQEVREGILSQLTGSSSSPGIPFHTFKGFLPAAAKDISFFEKQTLLFNYGSPGSAGANENLITYGVPQGQNPNWEIMGYPGPLSVPPKTPEEPIQPWVPRGDNITLEADVCVVGSGAGGAVIASRLSGEGCRVVVLEAGGHYTCVDFHQLELWSYQHLWYRGGATPTADGNVTLLAGGSLGGGTEINWMNCVRTPDLVRKNWVQEYGLDGIDSPDFDRYMDTVEAHISANSTTAYYNSQNLRMKEGCERLGYLSKQTHVNWYPPTFQPLMAGYTGFGDQTGSKQTARRTFLVDAYLQGTKIIVHCHADRILVERGRAVGVEATYSDPQGGNTKITIRAPQVVVAGGTLESPALLLRSGIGGPNVGKGLHVQPGGAVYGVYKEKQKGWWGSPMTANCEQFVDTGGGFGFYMEIPAFAPGFIASVIPWANGFQHKAVMAKVPYISTFIWFLRDRGSGQVTIDAAGNAVPTYVLTDEVDQKNFRQATVEAIRIHEAAGAQEIMVSLAHGQVTWHAGESLQRYIELVQDLPLLDGAQPMISAHQLSTCRMGSDPATSVADASGELFDVKGVWMGDGSACPTALGANPMVTIMALAERTSDRMLAASSATAGSARFTVTAREPDRFTAAMPDLNSASNLAGSIFRGVIGLMMSPVKLLALGAQLLSNPAHSAQTCSVCRAPIDDPGAGCCSNCRNAARSTTRGSFL
jgi:choline dehydrogenase-like flavoprotein